jgi:hypothetical protein
MNTDINESITITIRLGISLKIKKKRNPSVIDMNPETATEAPKTRFDALQTSMFLKDNSVRNPRGDRN